MKQDSNHIDELLRERLHDATAPPPAFVWPRVEAALRKRRRRFLFFWFFGTGLVSAGLLTWWLTTNGRSHAETIQQTSSTAQDISKTITAPIAASEPAARNHQTDAPEENVARTGLHTKTQAAVSGNNDRQGVSQKATAGTVAVAPAERHSDPTGTPEPAGTPGNPEKGLQAPLAGIYPFPVFQPLSSVQPFLISKAAKSRPAGFTSAIPAPINIVRNKKETRNCYDFAQHPNVLLLDAYLGPSLARKEMHTGPDNQPYLAQRRNTETRDWSFSAGLRASLLLDRHFLLRSGVHYDQVNEVFEYIDPNSVEVTIRQTTQIINGQPVTVIDTLGVEYGEHYLKTYNRFGMLDIPLEAGVELRNGRNGVSLNGGIALNVLFWKRGAILSPVDGRPAYYTPGKGTVDVFRANAGLSAIGSIQWFCHVRPRLRVFAEPYARVVLRPINVPNHPVEQRYGMLGLNIGMTRILD